MQRRLSPDPCRPPQHLTPSLVREANSPSQSTMANIHEAFIYTGAVCSRCFPRTPSLKGSQQHREKQHYPVLTLQTGDKGPQGIRDVSKATHYSTAEMCLKSGDSLFIKMRTISKIVF